jgi:hypothetical protein
VRKVSGDQHWCWQHCSLLEQHVAARLSSHNSLLATTGGYITHSPASQQVHEMLRTSSWPCSCHLHLPPLNSRVAVLGLLLVRTTPPHLGQLCW